MKNLEKTRVPYYVSVPLLLAGIYLCWVGIQQSVRAYQSTTWPAVDATIVNYRFDVTDGGTPTLVIQYKYSIDDLEHTSGWTHVAPEKCEDSDGYKNPPERFAKGESIVAYVSPKDPTVSLLKQGLGWKNTLPVIVGGGIIGIAFLGLTLSQRLAHNLLDVN